MKIEVGKFYKTRGGQKVEILSVSGRRKHKVVGYMDHDFVPYCWTLEGKFLAYESRSYRDILSEWVEPKPRLLAYLDSGAIMLIPETEVPGTTWVRVPHLDEPESKNE